ncbi:MAG TPA: hypothetical protein VLL03_06125 [Burkholderiales bacterium]|nr:hypothetical protein [Burkholderiales bacterium]
MKWIAIPLLMLPLASASAEPMGRLFFTPAQRETLDNARRQNIKIDVETEAPTLESISVNGVVKRSDGESIIWINNRPIKNQRAPGGIKITPRDTDRARVNVQFPQSGRNVDLKVGQSLDAVSGQVVESFQRPVPPAVTEKKSTAAEKPQPSPAEQPAAPMEKPKSRISSRQAGDEPVSEPSAPNDEQPANPTPSQPASVQY